MKKIDVYVNGDYKYSSINYKTCKEAKADIANSQSINVESIPPYMVKLSDGDKVSARIDHKYD